MLNEELELTLECAQKIRTHLMRMLESKSDEVLASKLQYVNSLILEADARQ